MQASYQTQINQDAPLGVSHGLGASYMTESQICANFGLRSGRESIQLAFSVIFMKEFVLGGMLPTFYAEIYKRKM